MGPPLPSGAMPMGVHSSDLSLAGRLPVAISVGLVASVEEANDLPTFVALAIVIAAVLVRQFLVLADNRRLLETMAAQALHDPLTGLANRTLLCERLSAAMTADRAGDRSLAVLCIDLDDFKLVNDSLGHAAGDVLLVQAGARIRGCVRGTDTVARLGGDEFAVLLEDASEPSIDVAHRIRRAFDAPFVLEGQPWVVLPSVGVATTAHAATADLILRNADLAMYAAKRDRGAGVAPYSPDMALIERDETDFARLRATPGPRPARHCSTNCAALWRPAISGWSTSRSSPARRARLSAWRHWCAGHTPAWDLCLRRCSSPSRAPTA